MAGHQGTATRRQANELLSAIPEAERGEINTTAMGEVIAYDAKTQTATIQPRLSMMIGGEKVRAPELISVPVMHPQAGGIIMHKPLKKGDEVMLSFNQRSLDQSADDGSDADNNRGRMHSLSDAVATPAAYSKPKQLSDLPADRVHFGTTDGKSGLQMKEDGTFDQVKNGDTVFKIMRDFCEAFRDHVHAGSPKSDKVAAAEAIIARIDAMKAS